MLEDSLDVGRQKRAESGDDSASRPNGDLSRRAALGLGVAGGLGALAYGGYRAVRALQWAAGASARAQAAFHQLLKAHPVDGTIAVPAGNRILIFDASTLGTADTIKPTLTVQSERPVKRVLVIDSDTIVFSSRALDENPKGTPHNEQDSLGSVSIVSDGVFMFKVSSGKITTLFDPYSPEASKHFGDVMAKDAAAEKAEEAEWSKEAREKRGGIHIRLGETPAELTIDGLAQAAVPQKGESASELFLSIKGNWYRLALADRTLERPAALPEFRPDGVHELFKVHHQAGLFGTGPAVFSDLEANAPGIPLHDDASAPASWYRP